jgi:hypothetical protein
MLQGFELNRAQQRNSVFQPDKVGARDLPGRDLAASGTASTRTGGDVLYHPRWALMQIGINLVLWAAIIAGAMLIVPRL